MENRNQQNKQGQNQQNQQQNNKQQNQQENKAQNKRNKPRGGYISEVPVLFCRGFLLLQLRTFYDRILLYKAHIKMKGMNFSGKEKFI